MLLIFLSLTIFFIAYYFKVVHPYTKDLKARKKEIISFNIASRKMTFNDTNTIIDV